MRYICVLCSSILVTACLAEEPETIGTDESVDDDSDCPVDEGSNGHIRVETESGPQTLSYIVHDCHAIHEMDLDLGHVSELRERGGAANLGYRWPGGIVKFALSPNLVGDVCGANQALPCLDVKAEVRLTLAALEWKIPVRFVEITYEEALLTSAVIFEYGPSTQDPAGLSNHNGMDESGPQYITFQSYHDSDNTPEWVFYHLGPSRGTIRHEMLHNLGVWHEQSRRDRNLHVSVEKGCIAEGRLYDYEMKDESADIGIYDFNSIVHYSVQSGCWKPDGVNCLCPTMTTIDPGASINSSDAANRGGLSIEDTNTLFQMYTESAAGQSNQRFGHALAVGDFDADGYDDLAVGAPFTDLLRPDLTTANDAGLVFVYRGTVNGPVAWRRFAQLDFTGQTTTANAQFGAAVAAYDANGDGIDDLAIGAPGAVGGAHSGVAGTVFVFRGTKDQGFVQHRMLTQANTASIPQAGDLFGAVLAAGPITGARRFCNGLFSTYDALAVGAPADRVPGTAVAAGSVFLFHENTPCSGASMLNPSTWLYSPEARAFGSAIAIGPLDLGSTADIAVGAPLTNGSGSVYLYKGVLPPEVPSGWSAMATFSNVIVGTQQSIFLGSALAIGKIVLPQPGIPSSTRNELAVGAPGLAGEVRVYRVTTSAGGQLMPALATTITNSPLGFGDEFGAALAIGNIDRSPFPTTVDELVIGAPGDDGGRGSVSSVRIGSGGTFIATPILQTINTLNGDRIAGDRFGQTIAIGQLDGSSGLPGRDSTADVGVRNEDLAIAARGETFEWTPWDPGSGASSGTVDVLWGSASGSPSFWEKHDLHGNYTNRLPNPQ